MLRPSSKQEIIEQLAVAYEQFPHENKDVHFTFPVLILLGDDDTTGKVSEYCRAWSNATGYPVHMIKNARHFSNGDNPEQVNAEIQKFADAVYACWYDPTRRCINTDWTLVERALRWQVLSEIRTKNSALIT